jgi:hypothetical protein
MVDILLPLIRQFIHSTIYAFDNLRIRQFVLLQYEFLHPRIRVAAVNREELTFFLSKRIQEIWAPRTDLVIEETIVKFFWHGHDPQR